MLTLLTCTLIAFFLGIMFAIFIWPKIEQYFLKQRIVSVLSGMPPTIPLHIHTAESFQALLTQSVPWLKNRLHEQTAGQVLAILRKQIPTLAPPVNDDSNVLVLTQFVHTSGLQTEFHRVGLKLEDVAVTEFAGNTLPTSHTSLAYAGTKPPEGFTLPAEYATLSGILLSWPVNYPTRWAPHATFARIIQQAGATAVILVPSTAWRDIVNAYLRAANIDDSHVVFFVIATDDVWIRDFGPHFVQNKEGHTAVVATPYVPSHQQNFQKWDNEAPPALARALGLAFYRLPLIVEGGNLVSDGAGTMVMFDSVCHHNPELSREDIEKLICDWFGMSRLILFPKLEGEITGHIDMAVKFHDAHTVLVADATPSFKWKAAFDDIAQRLSQTPSISGEPYRVVRVPIVPKTNQSTEFWSYINSLTVNQTIILPLFNADADAKAISIYESLGTHKIVGIDFRDFPLGSVHCQSKEIPVGVIHV